MRSDQAAYVAGIFDGDGSILKSGKYAIAIVLGQTDADFVKALSRYGGTVYKKTFKEPSKRNTMYYWILKIMGIQRAFLEKTLPYYRIKRKQAEIALQLVKELESKETGWKQECSRLQAQITEMNNEKPKDEDIRAWEGLIEDKKYAKCLGKLIAQCNRTLTDVADTLKSFVVD